MRNPDVIHSGTNIYRLNDRYPLAGVAQGATLFPAAFQGFRQQVQGLEDLKLERLVAVVVPENIAYWKLLEHIWIKNR